MRNRRGGVTMEAALVLPMVILTVITCILICTFFYTLTAEQSRMHMALRQNAGALTGHTAYPEGEIKWEGQIETQKKGIFKTVRGKERVPMKTRGILAHRVERDMESLWTASDGVLYVRYCTLISERANTR
ncbi:MAG: hypothetical protein IJI20_04490 [Firmicutes bacterium]|nr:hypothetical protein [Bacillota bacterium]